MCRENFFWTSLVLLIFCTEPNSATNMNSWNNSNFTKKLIIGRHKLLFDFDNICHKTSLDTSRERRRSYDLCLKASQYLPFNLEDSDVKLWDMTAPKSKVQIKRKLAKDSNTIQTPIICKLMLVIIICLSSLVISEPQSKKIEPITIMIALLFLVNPVYLAPLYYTPTQLTDNNGGQCSEVIAVGGVIGQGYCTMGYDQNVDTSWSFDVRKYFSDGTVDYAITRGTLPVAQSSGTYYRDMIFKDNKCITFYPTYTGATYYLKFYDGVPSNTDLQVVMPSNFVINKGIALTDGSYIAIGYCATRKARQGKART